MAAGAGLLVVASSSDEPVPTVVAPSDAVDPGDYADAVTELCTRRVAVAEDAGYEVSAAGADGLDAAARALAELPPPAGVRDRAQALVDGIDRYAGLFRRRDENLDQFSEDQNELVVVLEVRAAGLGASCGDPSLLSPPSRANAADLAEVDDAALIDAAGSCFEGDLHACDVLIGSDSPLVFYGVTCGGRLQHEEADENIGCVDSFAAPRPVGDQP